LKDALPESFSLVEILLSSSYNGWGTCSLDTDVAEIAQCVSYFRDLRPGGKIVLLGHSTGSQDIMHYLVSEGNPRPKIDGGILQSGVSDREAFAQAIPPNTYDQGIRVAREYIDDGRGEDCLPSSITASTFPGPVSAKRWMSLMSPGPEHDGQDDYFSSDFDDIRLRGTFGKIGGTGTPISILYGGNDEHVPESVDKEHLVSRWTKLIREGGGVVDESSGVIPGATHALIEGGEPVDELIRRIVSFLGRIEKH
jgi:pimeloyl-ACP methyl ester carboxylesterase